MIEEVQEHDPFAKPEDLLEGDFVQARVIHGSGTVEVLEGIVYGVSEGAVDIGGLVRSENDGWKFELISRAVVLPAVLSEIVATLLDGSLVVLMGRDTLWTRSDTGTRVDSRQIRSFILV